MSSLPSFKLTVFKRKNAYIQTTMKNQEATVKIIRNGIRLKLKIPATLPACWLCIYCISHTFLVSQFVK